MSEIRKPVAATRKKDNTTLHKKFPQFNLDSRMQMLMASRKGIKPEVFYVFADASNLPEKNLAGLLNMHPRTISNYRTKKQTLSPVESEHLLKLIALYAKGEEIFGTLDEMKYWLQKPFWDSGDKPVDWLVTPGGIDWISDEVDRLAQGYPV